MMQSNLMPKHRLIPVSTNLRHSICPTFLAQVMPKSTEIFGMTFAKIGHIECLEFAGTEMNRHSGKT